MTTLRQFTTLLCVLAILSSCGTTKHATTNEQGYVHPDDVFTLTEDDIERETRQVNSTIKGQWTYSGPSVDVSGKNVLAGLGKPIAKGKLKKKLKKAFKKIGLDKAKPQFTFNEDGTCAVRLLGVNVNGTFNYNPDIEKITIKWHGVPMTANLRRDGKKKVHITFDSDKLLKLFSLASRISDSSTLKALAFLTEYYDDVMVGFELKR